MTDEPTKNIDEVDDYEAEQNLLGFFQLLLRVDMRVNPQLYKKKVIKEPKENDR
jgi:hypothetical protein